MNFFTVGAYGHTEESFFGALQGNRIDTLVDIRRRRGMRGSRYAFANSVRLQERLAVLGISYVYIKELSPSEVLRDLQKKSDASVGILKRNRAELAPEFIAAYRNQCLAGKTRFDILTQLPSQTQRIALFCVEAQACACHRSLVAGWLARGHDPPITDI